MSDAAFIAKWQSWLNENKLFESRPGVYVKIGMGINDRRTFKQMVMGGFIFETKPGQYRVVSPYAKDHTHHFVCECGAEP